MAKKIINGKEAKEALQRGIDAVADAVRITIGPRGQNVVYEKGYGAPTISNDGVSIAKEITLPNKFENMGAELAKEVATKTNDTAGDGTTTSLILFQSFVREGLKRNGMGANGLVLKSGMEQASTDVIKELRAMAKPIKTKEEIKQVATISAESEEIGNIIAKTIEKVGKDGVVTVEESQAFGVISETTEGLEFDKGYISAFMITNTERMEAEIKNAYILVTDKKISSLKEILPIIEKVAETGKKEMVIIADDVDGEALTTLVVNKIRGIFSVLAVKAPGYGDRKKDELQDIATTIGAKMISEETGLTLEKTELAMLGRADRIISTKDKTIVVGGKCKKSELNARVEQLKSQLVSGKHKFEKEALEKRIAKLAGGVAVIKVGAATEMEMKYLKLKIEDAVNATKAAIEEGIVPGGGVALVKAAAIVRSKSAGIQKRAIESRREHEFSVGYMALVDSLDAPLMQIAKNAGHEDASVIIDQVRNSSGINDGYDAGADALDGSHSLVDMVKKGIIDPVKVTRTALQNAASAAAIILTTEVAIADIPEEKKNHSQESEM
ncbi:MAG: chaperonin GroEL, chaperonin GroEL [Candidatus Parcubacteria bacterium]|jgi:chaperonin GroEL